MVPNAKTVGSGTRDDAVEGDAPWDAPAVVVDISDPPEIVGRLLGAPDLARIRSRLQSRRTP
jgi:hypothetical protein